MKINALPSKLILGIFLILFSGNFFTKAFSQEANLFIGEPVSVSGKNIYQPLAQAFTKYSVYELNAEAIYQYAHKKSDGFLSLTLKLGDKYNWELKLENHDLRSNDYVCRVATDKGIEILPKEESFTYRGYVDNDPNNRVGLSIRNNVILGTLIIGGEQYFIEPLSMSVPTAPQNQFIVYNIKDVLVGSKEVLSCGVTEMHNLVNKSLPQEAPTAETCKEAEIAIATDYSMFTYMGSSAALQTRITDILNAVNVYYADPSVMISFRLTTLFIAASAAQDTWTTSTDFNALLSSFAAWGQAGGFGAAVYDVATLWTFRASNLGDARVGQAQLGAVCPKGYNVCQHWVSPAPGRPPVFFPSMIQAHELGHNFSANHASGPPYIMAPLMNATCIQWDPAAISAITSFKQNSSCLSACSGNSVNEITSKPSAEMFLYPNPTQGICELKPIHGIGKQIHLNVINIIGEVVYTLEAESTTGVKRLDLSDLPSGIYTVIMKEGEENYYQKLIVI